MHLAVFPRVFVKRYDPGIKPGLIVPIKCQMPAVIPLSELVDDLIIEILLHALVGALFRVFVCGTEFTGRVAAIDRLKIDHIWFWNLAVLHEIVDIFLLRSAARYKLRL